MPDAAVNFVDRAVCKRKQFTVKNVPLRQGDIGVEIGQIGESPARLLKDAWQLAWNPQSHFQHLDRPV